jgi:type I restriction enzyme S subunit
VSDMPEGFRDTPLGSLPETWQTVPLKAVLTQVNTRIRDLDAEDDELPVLSLTKNKGLILQTERFGKRIATKDVSKYKVVQRGQIVHNPYVIWEGAVHILDKYDQGIVSPVYPVWEVSPLKADPYFVDPLLRMPAAIAAYNRFAAGAVNRRRSIRTEDFLSVEIPLPPLPEQHAITHVLQTVQQAREATERVVEAARELKRSLMRHLFTYGPIPVSQADQMELQETEIGPVPKHWKVVSIEEVIEGTQYGTSSRAELTGKYPMLRMNNLSDGRVDISDLKYIDLDNDELAKFRVNKGDILFNRTNSFELVGKTSIFDLDGDYVFASYLIRVVADRGRLLPEYLNYYLNDQGTQSRLKQLATRGVSQSNINATKLKGFEIYLPPLPEQREIAHILTHLDAKITAEEARRDALDDLFHTLLHHLMTAKVRVPPHKGD